MCFVSDHKTLIRDNFSFLVKNMDCCSEALLDTLLLHDVINETVKVELQRSSTTSFDKNEKLFLHMYKYCSVEAWKSFLEALQRHKLCHVVDDLKLVNCAANTDRKLLN